MKVAVVSSDAHRHLYFGSQINKAFDLVLFIAEQKEYHPEEAFGNREEELALQKWFADRDQAEIDFFSKEAAAFKKDFPEKILTIEPRKINDSTIIDVLKNSGCEAVAVFGSSLLKADLLNSLKAPVINMHLGLSPYYRGAGTNFWPFYNNELEYVGVTIHWIDLGIDSGNIIRQGRPVIEAGDTPHSIGCKTIEVGTALMIKTLKEVAEGIANPGVSQTLNEGKLYKRKDFSARHVLEVNRKMDEGLITEYARSPRTVQIIE